MFAVVKLCFTNAFRRHFDLYEIRGELDQRREREVCVNGNYGDTIYPKYM